MISTILCAGGFCLVIGGFIVFDYKMKKLYDKMNEDLSEDEK